MSGFGAYPNEFQFPFGMGNPNGSLPGRTLNPPAARNQRGWAAWWDSPEKIRPKVGKAKTKHRVKKNDPQPSNHAKALKWIMEKVLLSGFLLVSSRITQNQRNSPSLFDE
jgi:hypothetical protein